MIDRRTLLAELPPYIGESVIIKNSQAVKDIISEMVAAQKEFAPYYDSIALYFDAGTVAKICNNIYSFEKRNFIYKEETEDDQTTGIPAAILTRGNDPAIGVDCKHFALFASGILAGLNRLTGRKIDWEFRFASYNVLQPTPYHVFVVVKDNGSEIWIDATPGVEGKVPVWQINKPVNDTNMPLRRIIAGVEELARMAPDVKPDVPEVPYQLIDPLNTLFDFGVLSPMGVFDEQRYKQLYGTLPENEFVQLQKAMDAVVVHSGVVGSLFGDIFKGVQHFAAGMGMQIPRASFLALVRLNAFHYADKLASAILYTESREKLEDLWWRVGGDEKALRSAIAAGKSKKPVISGASLGCGCGCKGGAVGCVEAASGAACLIASAAVIVAAIIPVITALLKKNNVPVIADPNIDPNTGMPYASSGSSVSSFVTANMVPIAAAALLLGYYYLND